MVNIRAYLSFVMLAIAMIAGFGCRAAPMPNGGSPLAHAANSYEAELNAARKLERQGKLELARNTYQRLCNEKQCAGVAHWRLAVMHDQAGNHEAAAPHYRSAFSHGVTADLLCDYGYSCYLRGENEAAINHLRQALEYESDLVRARNNLGLALARAGQRSEAMAQFYAAGCSPEQATANLDLAMATRDIKPVTEVGPTSETTSPNATDVATDVATRPAPRDKETPETEIKRPSEASEAVEDVPQVTRVSQVPPRNPSEPIYFAEESIQAAVATMWLAEQPLQVATHTAEIDEQPTASDQRATDDEDANANESVAGNLKSEARHSSRRRRPAAAAKSAPAKSTPEKKSTIPPTTSPSTVEIQESLSPAPGVIPMEWSHGAPQSELQTQGKIPPLPPQF